METQSFRSRLIGMRVGETIEVSAPKVSHTTIRPTVSNVAFQYDRTYKTHVDRKTRIYEITRTA